MKTVVIGHKNPDMDSICSAIAYAEFKRLTGTGDAVAARCGHTNERIDFALKKFGFAPPVFIHDVHTRVSDVMESNVVYVHVNSPVYEAMTSISEHKYRGMPVVDDAQRCVGILSGFKIGQYLFPPLDRISSTRIVEASLSAIRGAVHGKLISGEDNEDVRPHMLVVAAMHTTTFKKRLAQLDAKSTVLIVGDRWNIQKISIDAGVRALLITNDSIPRNEVIKAAKERGVTVLVSPHDTATTVLLARAAVTAGQMLVSDFKGVASDLPLREVRQELAMSSQFAFPVLGPDGRLEGILSKSDFLKDAPLQLILVDHNELTQAVTGADEVPIIEIIDHHRIGVAPTHQPILFLNRPVGSTSTIVANCYQQAGIPIPPPVAGILMCGLISDTLNLTSPTTTDVDRLVLDELAKISGVIPVDLASEIFSVGSPLLTLSPSQVITADCKEYTEKGSRFSVSQVEELSFSHLNENLSALIDALEAYRSANKYLFSSLLVTDVITQNSILLVRGDTSFTRLIDFPEEGHWAWKLDGVVSRKKQLLPYLTSLIARTVLS